MLYFTQKQGHLKGILMHWNHRQMALEESLMLMYWHKGHRQAEQQIVENIHPIHPLLNVTQGQEVFPDPKLSAFGF